MRRPGDGLRLSPRVQVAARNLAVDAVTAEVVHALRAAGVRSVLLKGPSVARWLYDDAPRMYADTDLLVAPDSHYAAGEVLAGLGFAPTVRALPHDRPATACAWVRPGDGAAIDLHNSVFGAGAPPPVVWSVLAARTQTLRVAGAEIEVLDPPGRALLLPLHALCHGPRLPQPLNDLARALDRVPFAVWAEAAELAAGVDAAVAFAAGLRMLPAGCALAGVLGLPHGSSLEAAVRSRGEPHAALSVDWFLRLPGLRPKLGWLWAKAFPPPAYLREWSPLARRGVLGLGAAYLWRPLSVARAAFTGARARRRVQRATGSD